MAIIVQCEGKRAKIVFESKFPNEAELQRKIYENPEIIPISDIKEDVRFTVLDRETPVQSGSIDILGVDSEGDLYIIETKLFTNPDKRRVLAQVLDYGAAIWSTYQNPHSFLQMLDERLSTRGTSLKELLEQSFGEVAEEVEERIRDCIESGTLRFIILMDRIPADLKTLIHFVNSYSNFSVYAVELEHYKYEDLHIFVPHVFGTEERKRVPTTGAKRWDEASFFQDLEEKADARTVAAVHKLYKFSKERADDVSWGQGGSTGSFNPKFYFINPKSLYTVWSNGRITVNFGWLTGGKAEEFRERLRTELKKVPSLARYIPDSGLKSPGIPPEAWVPVCDEFLAALERALSSAKELSD